MEKELQGKLVEILTGIQTAAAKASDFALEQLPDIAQSYIAYGRALYIAGFIVGVVLMAVSMYAWRQLIAENRKSHPKEGTQFLCAIGGFITGIAGVVFFAVNLVQGLLVWFAPKVWLLQEIAHLVSKMK